MVLTQRVGHFPILSTITLSSEVWPLFIATLLDQKQNLAFICLFRSCRFTKRNSTLMLLRTKPWVQIRPENAFHVSTLLHFELIDSNCVNLQVLGNRARTQGFVFGCYRAIAEHIWHIWIDVSLTLLIMTIEMFYWIKIHGRLLCFHYMYLNKNVMIY